METRSRGGLALMLAALLLLVAAPGARAQSEPPDLLNQSPEKPFNLEPPAGAVGVPYVGPDEDTVILISSDFSDPDTGDVILGQHAKSQWQVARVGDERYVVFDSGPTTESLTSIGVTMADGLEPGRVYAWRVRHADASGDPDTEWSEWSMPTRFVTQRKLIRNLTPENYEVARLFKGVELYADDDPTTVTRFPFWLRGAPLIQTQSNDRDTSFTGTLTAFESDYDLIVYVAYDDRATTLPAWLHDWVPLDTLPLRHDDDEGWKDDDDEHEYDEEYEYEHDHDWYDSLRLRDLIVSDTDSPVRALYAKRFPADQPIELGANLPHADVWVQVIDENPLAMYSVLAHPAEPLNHRPYRPWIQWPSHGHVINMPPPAVDHDIPDWWDFEFDDPSSPHFDPVSEDDLPGVDEDDLRDDDDEWKDDDSPFELDHHREWHDRGPGRGDDHPGRGHGNDHPGRGDDDDDDDDWNDRDDDDHPGRGYPRTEYVVFKSSPFKDADPRHTPRGTHKLTQWQIGTVYDMSRRVLDVKTERFLRRLPVPWEVFEVDRTYFVRVRYKDGSGKDNAWSRWSKVHMFTIAQPWNDDDDDDRPTTPPEPVVLLDQDLTSDTTGWSFMLEAGDLTTRTEAGLCTDVPTTGVNIGAWVLDEPIELVDRAVYRATVRIRSSNTEPNTQPMFLLQFVNRFWRYGGTKYFLANAGNEYLAGPEGRDYVMYFTPSPALIERFRDRDEGMFQPRLTEEGLDDMTFSVRILDTDNFGLRGGELCIESVKIERFDRPRVAHVIFDSDRITEGTFLPTGTARIHRPTGHTMAFNHPKGGFGGLMSRDCFIPWEEGWVYRIRFQLAMPSQLDREDLAPFRLTVSSEDWQFGNDTFALDLSTGFVAPPTEDEVEGAPERRGWYEIYTSSGPASQLLAEGMDGLRFGIDHFNILTDQYELPSAPGQLNAGQGLMHVRRVIVERVAIDD